LLASASGIEWLSEISQPRSARFLKLSSRDKHQPRLCTQIAVPHAGCRLRGTLLKTMWRSTETDVPKQFVPSGVHHNREQEQLRGAKLGEGIVTAQLASANKERLEDFPHKRPWLQGVCNAPNTLALVLPYRFELIREFAACTPTAPAFEASQSWGSTLVGLRPTARRKSMWVGGEKFTVRGVKFHGFHRRGIWFVGGPPLLGCAKHSDVPHQVFIPFQFG